MSNLIDSSTWTGQVHVPSPNWPPAVVRLLDFKWRTWLQGRYSRYFKHLRYNGPIEELHFKTTLARDGKNGMVLCQFDDTELDIEGVRLGFNWHEFPAHHFIPAGE